MTGYLLDTSVLWALAAERKSVSQALSDWMTAQGEAETLFISSIAVAELEKGISKLRRSGGTARAERLAAWLDVLLSDFGDHILAVDAQVARIAGAMEEIAVARGRHPGLAELLIAATAEAHDLLLLTANGRYFEPLGITHLDPFSTLPDA